MVGSLSISVISALLVASDLKWRRTFRSDCETVTFSSRNHDAWRKTSLSRALRFIVCSCSIVMTVCSKYQSLKSLNSSVSQNWARRLSLSVGSLWFEGTTVFFSPSGGSAVPIVSSLVSGSSGPSSSPGRGHCSVVLSKTLYSPTRFLSDKNKIFLETFQRLCWWGSESP